LNHNAVRRHRAAVSSTHPIYHPEPWDMLKVSCVVRHQRGAVLKGDCGN
jgi:hypothetical protein